MQQPAWLRFVVSADATRLALDDTAPGAPRVRIRPGMIVFMTVVKINAITVPADSGDELARRFAARAGAVDNQDGFEGFELLKPVDERTTWLVVTRWRDDEAFKAWVSSPAFGHGHRSAAERAGGDAPPPVGVSSELWSYEIAGGT
jgi:heme oxygenase (mycobilin-producing)